MLRERATIVAWLTFVVDMSAVINAFFLAYLIRNGLWASLVKINLTQHYQVLSLAIPVFALCFYLLRLYDSFRLRSILEELASTFRATFLASVALAVLIFLLNYKFTSRLFFGIFVFLSACFVAGQRVSARLLLRAARRRGYNYRNFLIVGSGARAQDISKTIREHSHWGLRVLGHIPEDGGVDDDSRQPVVGTLERFASVLDRNVVDGVVFAVEHHQLGHVKDAFAHCHQLGVPAYIFARPFDEFNGRVKMEDLGTTNLIAYLRTCQNEYQLFLKRMFDLLLSLVLMAIFAPVMILVALLIKLTSKGPVIFPQVRVGRNGRLFTLYKFRTMIPGAEEMKVNLAGRNQMDGPVFKIQDDPRVTPIGRLLRKASLDELPQLFNVLRGEMSIVGPRPPVPEEVERYEAWQRRRLSVQPGLTCLWQVNGRNAVDFQTWMKLDLEYVDNWSWLLDLKIILRTIPAMLRGW
jgi:exopolysaccharide biosynthesis polyprenyl glycosylphosphotransferase